MNRNIATALVTTAVAAVTLTACGTDNDRCDTSSVVFYSTTDHTYHYGSVTGRRVPTSKLPKSATKVPGYKPYELPKAAAPKAPIGKPGPAYKASKAPSFRKR